MTAVLRILEHTDGVKRDGRLAAYIERRTDHPVFRAPATPLADARKEAA